MDTLSLFARKSAGRSPVTWDVNVVVRREARRRLREGSCVERLNFGLAGEGFKELGIAKER